MTHLAKKTSSGPQAAESPTTVQSALFRTVSRLLSDETGVTAVEYGLIAALVGAVIIVSLQTLGTRLTATFDTISSQLK